MLPVHRTHREKNPCFGSFGQAVASQISLGQCELTCCLFSKMIHIRSCENSKAFNNKAWELLSLEWGRITWIPNLKGSKVNHSLQSQMDEMLTMGKCNMLQWTELDRVLQVKLTWEKSKLLGKKSPKTKTFSRDFFTFILAFNTYPEQLTKPTFLYMQSIYTAGYALKQFRLVLKATITTHLGIKMRTLELQAQFPEVSFMSMVVSLLTISCWLRQRGQMSKYQWPEYQIWCSGRGFGSNEACIHIHLPSICSIFWFSN